MLPLRESVCRPSIQNRECVGMGTVERNGLEEHRPTCATYKGLPRKVKIVVLSGKPCGHAGCLRHISHPCEGCGRIAGRGNVTIERMVVANSKC